MKRLIAAACSLLLLASLGRAEDKSPEKFESIYNGKDLTGWVVEGTDKFKDKDNKDQPVWTVTDDLIHCAGKGFGFLRWDKKEYADFALRLEYRMSKGCNSGVGIRTVKFTGPAETRPSFAAYEIQLMEDAGKKVDEHSSFSLYRYVPATSNPSKPAGEWNTLEIRCVGPRIQVTANGVLCQNTDQTTVKEIADKPLSGYVSVQNHGGVVDFRNVEILDLGGTIVEHKPIPKIDNRTPEQKAADDKKAADKKVADAKKAADKKATDEKKAADKKAGDKKTDDKKPADDKKPDDKKPATDAKPTSSKNDSLRLQLRNRTETAIGSGKWNEKQADATWPADQTALVICDLWDKHWCDNATQRCDAIAKKLSPVVDHLRSQGVKIVHCPSDTMDFYKDSPQRKRILAAPAVEPPLPIGRWCKLDLTKEAALPIDDTDGGCDDTQPVKSYKAWTREHPAISFKDGDVVSEDGREVYNYFAQQGVKHVIYCGVHTNMCVLGRSFGIRQMKQEGLDVALIRDLTDTMYNPQRTPEVTHDQGTELVIEHVEKYWCPTIVSAQLVSK